MNAKKWFEAMPDILHAELETLRHGLAYFEFLHQEPLDESNNNISIIGNIEYEEDKKQLVRILFPQSYPYTPPEIFPLEEQNLIINGIIARSPVPKPFYRGNQYTNNKICLFEDEKQWEPFRTWVGFAMNQARLWFLAVYSKEGFTSNLIVPESIAYLPHIGQILYYWPKEFNNSSSGRLICKSFKENYYSLLQVQEDNSSVVYNTFPDDTPLSPLKNNYIIGKWFAVKDQDVRTFLVNISNSQYFISHLETVHKIRLGDILPNPSCESQKFIIGFRIKAEEKLHCFQITYWKEGTTTKFDHRYLLPKNLNNELFARIDSLFNLEKLSKKKVLIVGLGAIGSGVASDLASCGVNNFYLVDDEDFDAGNSVRHASDLLMIGEKKVSISRKLILGKNPSAKVTILPVSIFQLPLELLEEIINNVDLVLDLTANALVEEYLNQKVCNEKGKTLIQAAVSKGALTGIILILEPSKSACLNCLKKQKLSQVPISALSTEKLENTAPDYGACSKPALPGSGIDTKSVSIQTARIALQLLSTNEESFYQNLQGHQYYWHGPAGTTSEDGVIHAPFEWEIKEVGGCENCEFCEYKL